MTLPGLTFLYVRHLGWNSRIDSFFSIQKQFKEEQETEKKWQKLVKTMDHLERAKREEAAPLVEAAFHKRLAEEKLLHERQQEVFCKLSVGLGG